MLVRALIVWFAIIAAESVNGIVRRLVAGDDLAVRQLGTGIGAAIVIAIALIAIRWIDPRNARQAFGIGALWVALTIIFDVALGRLTGASWERIVADFDLWHGGLLPLGLLVMLFSPLAAMKFRRR